MKSFKQFISEKKQTYVKGWTLKSKIHMSTTDFSNWHIKQVANNLSKFRLNERSILKIIQDAWPDAPEKFPKEHLEELENGLADNNVYIEEALQKKGYCMFVLDPTHGSISGWDEKSAKLGAKVLDDKYLPFEKDGFKLFEVKTIKGRPKYITSKFDWYTWLDGKKAAGKRTEIGSTMAQFREETLLEGRKVREKGWGHKSGKLVMTKIQGTYKPYHSQFLFSNLSKFGIKRKDIIDLFMNNHNESEKHAENRFDLLASGKKDRDPYLLNYMEDLGWHSVVVDNGNNAIEGGSHNAKGIHKIAKAIDKKYGDNAIFPDESAYIELGMDDIYNKYDWAHYIKTGKFGGDNRTDIGSTMAQFRESVEYVIWGIPPKDKDETLLLTAGKDGKRITKKSDAMKLLKLLVTKHGVKKARIQELDVEVDPSDMFRNPFG
jgi:hypothetical protein